MSYSSTFTEQASISGVSYSQQNTITGTGRSGFDETVANSETDYQITFTLDYSACVAFYLCSSEDVTFETNDGAAPDDTIALKAGIPYIWYTDKYDTFKITADVTTNVFITNASGSTATVRCEAVVDATP